ncbi:hypothetical protein [Acinetobacter rudis]|uniref:hypothetical protein n=1 Tax=Acinetobacter rudis TaxID=632955 RepID=UPI00333E6099
MDNTLWAVVCGNIRDELDFKLTISRLVGLRSSGKINHILLSTWKGEIDKYINLRKSLENLEIYLVESFPLNEEIHKIESGSVNFWRQSRQLLAALDVIPKNHFVLRVRTDRSLSHINRMEEMGVFDNYAMKVPSYGNFPKLFNYRVFVFSPKTIRLFHMIDFTFLGHSRDLYKIINFDFSELYLQKGLSANGQWFLYPFLREFAIIRDYLRITDLNNSIKIMKSYVDFNKEKSLFPELYYKVYAIYILALYTHFKILYFGKIDDKSLKETYFHDFFSSSFKNNLSFTGLGVSIRNEKVLKAAVEGELVQTFAYKSFLKYIHYLVVNGNGEDIQYNYEDYINLKKFVNDEIYGDNEKIRWYKELNTKPIALNKKYYDNYSDVLKKLNCIDVSNSTWNELTLTTKLEHKILNTWLELKNPSVPNTEKILLPAAKSGNEFAIYMLLDLCCSGKFTRESIPELTRVVEFFLKLHIRKKTNTNLTLRIAYKYFYAIYVGEVESANINFNSLFRCVLSKYEINIIDKVNGYENFLEEIIVSNNLLKADVMLLTSIQYDLKLQGEKVFSIDEVKEYYSINGDDFIVKIIDNIFKSQV